jgi:hypothetical protein
VDGVEHRRKVRVRWYGDLFGPVECPILEFKNKRGPVGFKEQHRMGPFSLGPGFSQRGFRDTLRGCSFPQAVRMRLQDLEVVLLNRYLRSYFVTLDGAYRMTIDTEMVYYNVAHLRNRFQYKWMDHRNVIVELKYAVDRDTYAHRVAGFFPFRVSKSSKYVRGIERVFL